MAKGSNVVEEVRRAVEIALGGLPAATPAGRGVPSGAGLRPPSGHVLLALSGGPDSRVLLDVLVALRTRLRLTLDVCIVDHGLRPGSANEAEAALEVARRLGVRGTIERVTIEDKTPRGARDARYLALARAAVACGAEAIALGHTASDQAETLIDHLLRGSGSRGLGAMAPKRSLGALEAGSFPRHGLPLRAQGRPGVVTEHLVLIRPLLEVARAEVEAYVEAEGLAVVRDPTNDDLRYRRSRIRARVMPLLREERQDLDRALVRLCERLRLDADYLDHEAARARSTLTATAPSGAATIDLDGMQRLHPAIQARILREMCDDVGIPGDRVPLDALLRLSRGRHGTSQIDLPGNKIAERRYTRLRIGDPQLVHPTPDEVPVHAGGTYELGPLLVRVPKRLANVPLVFRRPRMGDRIGSSKLSDVLVDKKVARPDRARLWALAEPQLEGDVTSGGKLRWVVLPDDHGPGKLAWEWPRSGLRPKVVVGKAR